MYILFTTTTYLMEDGLTKYVSAINICSLFYKPLYKVEVEAFLHCRRLAELSKILYKCSVSSGCRLVPLLVFGIVRLYVGQSLSILSRVISLYTCRC